MKRADATLFDRCPRRRVDTTIGIETGHRIPAIENLGVAGVGFLIFPFSSTRNHACNGSSSMATRRVRGADMYIFYSFSRR